MNDSLVAKIAWKIIQGKDFGYGMLQAKYLDDCRQPKSVRVNSSIWLGVRRLLSELEADIFCSIGDGTSISFWWDDWLGYRIADKINIPHFLRSFLPQKVSDYFFHGMWHFTEDFIRLHSDIVLDILMLPLGERDDVRYWKPSLSGEVSSSLVYNKRCHQGLNVKWGSWIWAKFLPVRRSIICWRAIRGRLPTFDILMRCDFRGPNICMLCFRNAESIDHIFWECEFSRAAWKDMLSWFDISEIPNCFDLNAFLVFAMEVALSPQFRNLWRFAVVTLIWALWSERNSCIFEGKNKSYLCMLGFVKAAAIEANKVFNMGVCFNTWADYKKGRDLGISCRFAAPPSLVSVAWWPPLPGWLKVNTDGSALGSPGHISAGGVFRDTAGLVRGCFHVDGGRGYAFEAELLAAITAIEIAYVRGWRNLWLETDSTYIAQLLERKSISVPWRFANTWRMTLYFLESMEFRVSHIFREGNQVADIMARPDTPEGWWPYSIPLITHAVTRDMSSPRFYRVV